MNLFVRKSIAELTAEAKSGTLKRTLGAFNLTTLGIGAIIGAGIFVITGTAAAQFAGPAPVISMIIAAIGCAFAGLCYAEFASMIPVAGSAYTYAYATLGELFAWVIGWDLVLEYAVSSATVATGWSGYFPNLLRAFGLRLPAALAGPAVDYDPARGRVMATGALFNLPAVVAVAGVTFVLVLGIRESARINTALVAVKLTAVLFVIVVGAF